MTNPPKKAKTKRCGKGKKARKKRLNRKKPSSNIQEETGSHLLGEFNSVLIKYRLLHVRQFWFIYTFLVCI